MTGGAGFIGSYTVDLLTRDGYSVQVLDSLALQVHGSRHAVPSYISPEVRVSVSDVRDRESVNKALKDADAVIHLASAVGVGQSMYEIERYVDANTRGTATILDSLANEEHNVKKFVVASSMSIYGEGKYFCDECDVPRYPDQRAFKSGSKPSWEHQCPHCGNLLVSVPTDEETPLRPTSIYACTKRHQEEMCLLIGRTYGIPTISLRYFNAYGPRQSMGNPYTGAAAIFMSRILNGKPPHIFEDGKQQRDFVFVEDIARANVLALEANKGSYQAFNIGTGLPTSILALSQHLVELCHSNVTPRVTRNFRKGDVRHCYADTSKAERVLGYKAETSLKKGLRKLISWALSNKGTAVDNFEQALAELERKALASFS